MADYRKVESDIKEKLVSINRITKVVKGGRRFGFAALVVVGNQKGSVGIGQGKSKQVPDAIKKATEVAQQLVKRIAYRRAMKRAMQSCLRLGARGIKVSISGRLGGNEIARTEWLRDGSITTHW